MNETKEKMLSAIYKKVADKTLSFGCLVWGYSEIGDDCDYIIRKCRYSKITMFGNEFIPIDKEIFQVIFDGNKSVINGIDYDYYGNIEYVDWRLNKIIGHPVMLGTCDILFEKGPNYFDDWIVLLDLWVKKDKPIDEQNIECIKYIYNLIK